MKALSIALFLLPSIAVAETAPEQFFAFCAANIEQCAPADDARAPLTNAIRKINAQVNSSMKWERDPHDIWKMGGRRGDCEDIALTKRARMIREGAPAGSLRMALVVTPSGQEHAVLVLKTPSGDMVLDNRTDEILPVDRSGYEWKWMASANPFVWEKVE